MKKRVFFLKAICFWVLLPVVGCTPPLHIQLQFGECKLKKIRINDSKPLYFQLLPRAHLLRFCWEGPKGNDVTTTLPFQKFSFVLDDTKEVPTVRFTFKASWAYQYPDHTIKEEDKLSYINSDYLTGVQIRISRSDWEKEGVTLFLQSRERVEISYR